MTTPTLTSCMFKKTSHLNLSVPQTTATRNVATGTVKSQFKANALSFSSNI